MISKKKRACKYAKRDSLTIPAEAAPSLFRLALHTSLFLALSFPDLFMGIALCFYLSTVRPVRPPRSHRLQRLAPPASDVLANSLHSSRCPPASGFVHPKSTPSTSRAPLAAASPTPGRWRWPFPPWWLIISDSSLVLSATAPHRSPAVLFSSAAQMIPVSDSPSPIRRAHVCPGSAPSSSPSLPRAFVHACIVQHDRHQQMHYLNSLK